MSLSSIMRVPWRPFGFAMLLLVIAASAAHGAWLGAAWKFRRPLDLSWQAGNARGDELATVEFYTAGHPLPNGEDIRVATDEGRLVASHVLMSGPGDHVSLVFAPVKSVTRYYVYFGNEAPPPPPPQFVNVKYHQGLLLEMRELGAAAQVDDSEQIRQAWQNSSKLIGRTILEAPFLGINPFGPQERTISRVAGQFAVPLDGSYTFALATSGRGALFIDGQPVVFAKTASTDSRFRATLALSRGTHELLLYAANLGGDGRFAVAWMRPDTRNFEVMSRAWFGAPLHAVAGPLEELHKTLVADFSIEYGGECFYAGHYSHRYQFIARTATASPALQLHWNFGDGQTSTAPQPQHVFLADGTYPITLTVRIGGNSDAQTTRLEVSRDWAHIDHPPPDPLARQASYVQQYDWVKLTPAALPWAVLLQERAGNAEAMLTAAKELAVIPSHPDVNAAISALRETAAVLREKGKVDAAAAIWEQAPASGDLQPQAAEELARLLLGRLADYRRALAVLQPYRSRADRDLECLYGQSLILSGQPEEGARILRELAPQGDPARRAAVSGAMARTIEFYLAQHDAAAARESLDRWQRAYPADFLEGYSVLLQVRLLELEKAPSAAAKLAEAFSEAVPASPYAPQLLDKASHLLANSDASQSQHLRKMLKERYPEDPLSQN